MVELFTTSPCVSMLTMLTLLCSPPQPGCDLCVEAEGAWTSSPLPLSTAFVHYTAEHPTIVNNETKVVLLAAADGWKNKCSSAAPPDPTRRSWTPRENRHLKKDG